ncbi:MAG: hypothetical protein JWQ29_2901 [Phenylobacterium sp.]|nr:hypothetical protein [Phenylobacterium sp.]
MTEASDLDAEDIFDTAARDYGLERYADPGVRERFIKLVALFNNFGKVPAKQLPPAIADLKHAVVNRLMLARDWAEHPEILDQEVVQPIFIAGNGRAGTTLAQSLFALDEGHRTPRYVDALYPSPPRGLYPRADETARRAGDAYVASMLAREPGLLISHPYHDKGGLAEAEDEFIYSGDFHTLYPMQFLNVPTLPPSPRTMDRLAALQFHKNMLRQLQWKTPTKRWVGKGLFHQYVLSDLFEVFPDAIVVWTHRAPEDFVASLVAVTEFVYRPVNGPLYRLTPNQIAAGIKAGFDNLLKDPMIDDPRISHVRFADMVKDPVSVIRSVYETQGLTFTAGYEAKLRDRLADPAHRADRHGKFTHPNSEFGLDTEELKAMFANYRERFGL